MKSILSCILLILFLVHKTKATSWLLKHEVHIYSELPKDSKPLTVQCKSKDDDLGNHTLYTGQEFNWHFRSNFFITTLFYCNFWWESKQSSFKVFDASWFSNTYMDNYVVRADGFYYSDDEKDHLKGLKKGHDWGEKQFFLI